jgi:hypothetical protein
VAALLWQGGASVAASLPKGASSHDDVANSISSPSVLATIEELLTASESSAAASSQRRKEAIIYVRTWRTLQLVVRVFNLCGRVFCVSTVGVCDQLLCVRRLSSQDMKKRGESGWSCVGAVESSNQVGGVS